MPQDTTPQMERFSAAFRELVRNDMEGALQLITGLFVGLTIEHVRRAGGEATGDVYIDSCGARDITIHAPRDVGNVPK